MKKSGEKQDKPLKTFDELYEEYFERMRVRL